MPFLPDLVFPFVKSIKHDDNALFEIVLSFLLQYCQLWFERFPNNPIHILKTSVEVIIAKESISLIKHLKSCGFGVAEYAWPLLRNIFSVVLPKDDWLKLFDHIFTYHEKPELLFYFNAAYLLSFRNQLTKISSVDEMLEFTESQNYVDMKMLLKETFRLYKKYQDDDEIYIGTFGNYIPINQNGQYQFFTNYPTENVAYAKQIRMMKLNDEQINDIKQKEMGELRDRISKLLLRDQQVREQSMTIAEQEAQKYKQKQIELEQQILMRLKEQDERSEYLRKLEENLASTIENQKLQKQDEQFRLVEEYEQRKKLVQYEQIMNKQEQDLSKMEKNAALRIHDMISLRQKEDYEKQINKLIENHPLSGHLDQPESEECHDSNSKLPSQSK